MPSASLLARTHLQPAPVPKEYLHLILTWRLAVPAVIRSYRSAICWCRRFGTKLCASHTRHVQRKLRQVAGFNPETGIGPVEGAVETPFR